MAKRKKKPLARLNHFFWKYKKLFIPGLLCAAASAAFSVAVPMMVRIIIDSMPRFVNLFNLFAGTEVQGYLFTQFFVCLLLFGAVIICLSLLSGTFTFLMRQTIVVMSRHVEYDLRNQLYDHLQGLSRSFYVQHATGDLMTRATSDIEQVRRYIGPAMMYSARAVVFVVAAVSAMIFISPRLTLFAILPMPLLAISVFFVARVVHARSDALQKQYSKLTSRVQEALAGIRVLKAYTREEAEAASFEEESALYKERMLDLALVDAIWRPVFLILIGMSAIIVVWVGGGLVAEGAITIGNIAEFIIYVTLMTWPVASMGFVITMIQRASASMTRLASIFDASPDVSDSDRTVPTFTDVTGAIAFEKVGFKYTENGPWVLKDVSFDIPAGSTLAIVGRTGSGKSTLVEMVARLFDPTEGVVKIDGQPAPQFPVEVLRSSIGYVPQEVFLFSDTVANNIAFGRLDAGQEAIDQAAREAELLDNIRDFPKGFETFVGERGITLSGGQKQRSSIARALIRDPRILILDDALSAVDTKTESNILGHLRNHFGQRTIVIVSHRISAVQEADLILVLDEGKILEQGGHAALLKQNGVYAELHRKQLLEQEIEALT
ncbi:MAG: ABC transporter ATP-binding protein [Bacteroidota bacterium]